MLLEQIARMTPEYWATAGILIIGLDLFVLSSSYLAFIGLTCLCVAGVDALGASTTLQAWSLVLGAPLITVIGMNTLRREPEPSEQGLDEDLTGATGRVAALNPDDPSRGLGHLSGRGEWPIHAPGEPLEVNAMVRVIGVDGPFAVVETTPATRPTTLTPDPDEQQA